MSALFDPLTGLVLLDPWLLLLMLLLPLCAWAGRRRGVPAVAFAPAPLLRGGAPMPRGVRSRLCALPACLQVLALGLVAVALCRPVRIDALPAPREGIDILLCLDVSSSMLEKDLDPARTRLDVALQAAAAFVAARPDDRIGLLCFSRYPDLRCPPTLDHEALKELLAAVTPVGKDSLEDATGIGTAVARAAQVLRGPAGAGRGDKVVILLTDGEENVATAQTPEEIAPLHAAQLCLRLGVRVHAVAAGAAGAAGRPPPDPRQIEDLAARTGGRAFAARSAAALEAVYADIDRLEAAAFADPRYRVEERFLPFLCAGLVLLGLSRALRASGLEALP